ncbi:MAG: alpha/beta hydrolase [Gammaproteobacteria bacterium]|nr:alpha/beta hydrolase [Gammaproteobacteria bacterium]
MINARHDNDAAASKSPAPRPRRRLGRLITKAGIIVVAALAVMLLALALIGSPWRAYEAARLLLDLAALDAPDSQRRTPPMMRAPVTYEVDHRTYRGDVYRPLEEPQAGLVLLHGASPLGKDEPRLVDFAATLASTRFVVLVPDLVGLRQLKLRAVAARDIADAVLYMQATPGLAPNNRIGIVSLSVASGPALLAAAEPRIRERLGFILAIGGYYDMLDMLTFSTTGDFKNGAQWHHREPNEYGKWVLVLSNVDQLPAASDRRVLTAIARRKLKDPRADVTTLAARLSPQGRAVYDFVNNTDRQRVQELFAQLPMNIKSEIQALSLSKRDLSGIKAQVILVHGLNDPMIPYTESVALAGALPPSQVRLFLVNGLVHVDLKPAPVDYWRIYRAVYTLLLERDR